MYSMFGLHFVYFITVMRRMTAVNSMPLLSRYEPPSWTRNVFTNLPYHGRVHLGNFPTPVQRIHSRDDQKNILLQKNAKIQYYLTY